MFLKDQLFSFGIVHHLRFVLYATGITICTYTIAVLSRCYPLLSPCCHIDPETENLPWVLPITQVYFCMCLFFRKSVPKKQYLNYNSFTLFLLCRFVYSYRLNRVQFHAGCPVFTFSLYCNPTQVILPYSCILRMKASYSKVTCVLLQLSLRKSVVILRRVFL